MTAIEPWWAPRRDDESTAEFLGRVLDELGAPDLAANARAFHYDDFRCTLPDDIGNNIHRLITEVEEWAAAHHQPRRARVVMEAARQGEFDGTLEEARAWQASPEGQSIFGELLGHALRKRGER